MATISVDVDIDEFDDEDIIQEAIDRKLVAQILAANKEDATGPSALAVKAAQNLYCSLTTRQYARAQAEMRILLEALLPPAIVAAEAAMREGSYQQAICDLDKFFPTPKPVFYIKETSHVPPHNP